MRDPRSSAASVRLTSATPADAPVLQNLIQLYTHDFSEFWAGTPRAELNADGRFEDYPLSGYWSQPSWSALFIWRAAVLAGFSLINDRTPSAEAAGRNVAEFFILRKHRRQGVGQIAARHIFSSHPGWWEVAVARKNLAARRFWLKTLQDTGRASHLRELDLRGPRWDGQVFRFDWT